MELIRTIRNWSEVWALLIPLVIILRSRPLLSAMYPIVFYVWFALVLNSISTTMFVFHKSMPSFLQNNNILYNLHSILRVTCLGFYIYNVRKHRYSFLYKILIGLYALFVVSNFIFFESILLFSTRIFAAESIILLILCLTFFVNSIQDDSDTNWLKHPAFLICGGISFYEAVNFFIFLLFYPLSVDESFIQSMWTVHNITYVILCITIALALYSSYKKSILHQTAKNGS
ncbi:MAG: hypothetical protein ABUL41_01540 [Chitinophagaceae bacterium]